LDIEMATPARELQGLEDANDNPRCRICDGLVGRKFETNGFTWFDCAKCSTIQKVLTHQQYLDLNPSYDPGAYLDSANREDIERFLHVAEATRSLSRWLRDNCQIQTSPGSSRSFLDVGCGMGANLLAAQRLGLDVQGFEPSATHAHIAINRLHLPVVPEYFTAARVGDRKFDVVMLSHVIEHIYEPKIFLQELLSVLKPGGVLVVITPNRDSIIARLTGNRWPMLKPVDHVTMIGATAYSYFGLDGLAKVHHCHSEYPFEFAATVGAVLKAMIRGQHTANNTVTPIDQPSTLRQVTVRAAMLKAVLTAASVPAWLLAATTGRQACLISLIVKRSLPLGGSKPS
jgi:SAM-dependent methyltransferase